MKITHLAIYAKDLEKMKSFYERYFLGKAGPSYHNPQKNFTSYFLSLGDGPRLELMNKQDIPDLQNGQNSEHLGIIHFAISVGSKARVDSLTEEIKSDGYQVVGEPRTTGDGYYESVVLDPEGNRIEITI